MSNKYKLEVLRKDMNNEYYTNIRTLINRSSAISIFEM